MTAPRGRSLRVLAICAGFVLGVLPMRGAAASAHPTDSDSCRAAPGAEPVAAVFERWNSEVWDQGRLERVPDLAGPIYVRHDATGTRRVTAAEYTVEIAELRRAMPGMRFVVHDCAAVGDRVWTRWTMVGKNRETGRMVYWKAAQIYRIANGRLVETWIVRLPTEAAWPEVADTLGTGTRPPSR